MPVGGWVASLRRRLNGLHWALLLVYVLNGMVEAFPLTAFESWLQNEIHVSPSAQSTFYATIFVPWSLKPLFAWLSESVPIRGRRRKPYLIISGTLSACTYLLVAFVVKTQAGALAVTLARTAANACTEIIADLAMLDYAGRDRTHIGHIQSAVAGVRAVSSILALLLGMPLYPCTRDNEATVSARHVLAAASAFPMAIVLCAFFISEPTKLGHGAHLVLGDRADTSDNRIEQRGHNTRSGSSSNGGHRGRGRDGEGERPNSNAWKACGDAAADDDALVLSPSQRLQAGVNTTEEDRGRFGSGVASDSGEREGRRRKRPSEQPFDEAAYGAWAQQDLEETDDGAGEETALLLRDDEDGGVRRRGSGPWGAQHSCTSHLQPRRQQRRFPVFQLAIPAVLLLLTWSALRDLMSHRRWLYMLGGVLGVNALVAAGIAYAAATRPSVQLLKGIGGVWPALVLFLVYATPTASTQVTSWYYATWPKRPCYTQVLNMVSSCSRVLGSGVYFKLFGGTRGRRLLTTLIAASVAAAALQLLYVPLVRGDISTHNPPQLAYACACVLATGAASQVAMLAFLTVATRACPDPAREGGGLVYALVLSFLDFGDSVSGWISAPIARQLNITLTDYTRLPDLIYIDAGTTLGVAPVMLLLALSPALSGGAAAVAARATLDVEADAGEHGAGERREVLSAEATGSGDEERALVGAERRHRLRDGGADAVQAQGRGKQAEEGVGGGREGAESGKRGE